MAAGGDGDDSPCGGGCRLRARVAVRTGIEVALLTSAPIGLFISEQGVIIPRSVPCPGLEGHAVLLRCAPHPSPYRYPTPQSAQAFGMAAAAAEASPFCFLRISMFFSLSSSLTRL